MYSMLVGSDSFRLIRFCVFMPQEYTARVCLSSPYLWVKGSASPQKRDQAEKRGRFWLFRERDIMAYVKQQRGENTA